MLSKEECSEEMHEIAKRKVRVKEKAAALKEELELLDRAEAALERSRLKGGVVMVSSDCEHCYANAEEIVRLQRELNESKKKDAAKQEKEDPTPAVEVRSGLRGSGKTHRAVKWMLERNDRWLVVANQNMVRDICQIYSLSSTSNHLVTWNQFLERNRLRGIYGEIGFDNIDMLLQTPGLRLGFVSVTSA